MRLIPRFATVGPWSVVLTYRMLSASSRRLERRDRELLGRLDAAYAG